MIAVCGIYHQFYMLQQQLRNMDVSKTLAQSDTQSRGFHIADCVVYYFNNANKEATSFSLLLQYSSAPF